MIEGAFIKEGAVQCGFCIPGMIMAVEGVLRLNKPITEDVIKEGLSGNICRCTGYQTIYNAVKSLVMEVKHYV
jgi:aerobic-type carbon monoxide dehydrogenase small subunit (CoxS/CutS family)